MWCHFLPGCLDRFHSKDSTKEQDKSKELQIAAGTGTPGGRGRLDSSYLSESAAGSKRKYRTVCSDKSAAEHYWPIFSRRLVVLKMDNQKGQKDDAKLDSLMCSIYIALSLFLSSCFHVKMHEFRLCPLSVTF